MGYYRLKACDMYVPFTAAIVTEVEKENMIPWYDRTDFDSLSDEEDEKSSIGIHEQQSTSTSRSQRSKRKTQSVTRMVCYIPLIYGVC